MKIKNVSIITQSAMAIDYYSKKEKGITLVALIITIIILVILAAVSISAVYNSKIIGYATNGTYNYATESLKENIILDGTKNLIDSVLCELENIAQGSDMKDDKEDFSKLTIEEILKNYSAEEIAKNDEILKIVLDYPTPESINILTTSKEAMTLLGKNEMAKEKIMNSDEWGKAIANSEYRKDFSEYIVYDAGTLCTVGGGRNYYKVNDGIALCVAYYVNGNGGILVSKNKQAVLGSCSYDINFRDDIRSLEFNGETWYYSTLPYGWNDGTTFSSIYYGKNIGSVAPYVGFEAQKEAALIALTDFFTPKDLPEIIIERILKKYSAEEIAKNDELLKKILDYPTPESINILTSSQEAMTLLGKNKIAKEKIMNSDEWGKAIANSEYRKDFSEYIVYDAGTLCTVGGGRNYYKVNDGIALCAVYYITGEYALLVSKNEQSVVGACSYDINFRYEKIGSLEFNGETWYYSPIPYGWNDGTTFSAIYCGKNIGRVTSSDWDAAEEAALIALNDFFNS